MSIIRNIRFFSSEVPPIIEVAQGSSALEMIFNSLDLPILSTDSVRIYVKKPSGAKPGKVIFTHNRTVYVDPGEPDSVEK